MATLICEICKGKININERAYIAKSMRFYKCMPATMKLYSRPMRHVSCHIGSDDEANIANGTQARRSRQNTRPTKKRSSQVSTIYNRFKK